MKWLSSAWKWIRDVLWPFLKKWKKPIVVALGAIALIFIGKTFYGIVRTAILGAVKRKDDFKILDADHISVWSGKEWQVVDLTTIKAGNPVKAKNVVAIQYEPGKPAVVEVNNNVLQRVKP